MIERGSRGLRFRGQTIIDFNARSYKGQTSQGQCSNSYAPKKATVSCTFRSAEVQCANKLDTLLVRVIKTAKDSRNG